MFDFSPTFEYSQWYADIIQTVCAYCCNLGFVSSGITLSLLDLSNHSLFDSTKQTLYFPYSLLFTPIVLLVLTMTWFM